MSRPLKRTRDDKRYLDMGALLSTTLNDAVFPKKGRPAHDDYSLKRWGFEAPENGHYAFKWLNKTDEGIVAACFHGNMETTSNSLHQWLFLRCRALIGFEYPGYGLRHNEDVTQAAVLAQIPAWIDTIENSNLDKNGVVACGRSLGTFTALNFALTLGEKCKGIVLVSPMLTAAATKLSAAWYRVATLIDLLDNESTAKKLSSTIPVLIIHGEKDMIIPKWNSEALKRVFESNNNPVELHVIADKGHNNLMQEKGEVQQIINNFISRI